MTSVYKNNLDYPAQSGRYRLIISQACPYAQRTHIVYNLLNLKDHVSLGVTSPIKTEEIWDFSNSKDGVDPILGVTHVKDLYYKTDPDYTGPYSVPVLVDTYSKTVVNQESLEIVKDFNQRFKQFSKSQVDLYPEPLQDEIDSWVERITTDIIQPPYRTQYTSKQDKYDHNVDLFFTALEDLDKTLKDQDYIMGEFITLVDIVLYTPLVRFDLVTYPYQSMNKYQLQDFPHLWDYLLKLHHTSEFGQTTDFDAIKKGLFLGKNGQDNFNRQVIPAGPNLSSWK